MRAICGWATEEAIMPRRIGIGFVLIATGLAHSPAARADVIAEPVNQAIKSGVEYLESQQQPNGGWSEHGSDPGGGLSALCTRALLNSGRTPEDESVKK